MHDDTVNPSEETVNAVASEPGDNAAADVVSDDAVATATAAAATANRKGAAIVLVAIVVVLAGFFGYVAMAPKGKPADGTLPVNPVGFAIPDVRMPALNKGGDIGTRDFLGKPVVINFWASWCVTCKDEAAIMGAAERKWRDQGVIFIGIDASDKDDSAKKFEALYGMDYESLVDADGVIGPNWGVTGYPETFFVGRDGRIVSKFISAIDAVTLDQRVMEILNS